MATIRGMCAAAAAGALAVCGWAGADQVFIDQLPWDGQDGQLSFENPLQPAASARAADDFTLPANPTHTWDIKRITAQVITNIAPGGAEGRIEIYGSDSTGAPSGAPLWTLNAAISETGLNIGGGFRVVDVTAGDGVAPMVSAPGGETLWVSALLVKPGASFLERSYFATAHSGGPFNGSAGYSRAPGATVWQPLTGGCCIAPADFAFSVEGGEGAVVVLDQLPEDGLDGQLSQEYTDAPTTLNARAADDFVMPSNTTGMWRITRLRARLITTATVPPATGHFEIYGEAPGGGPRESVMWSGAASGARKIGPYALNPDYDVWEVTIGDGVSTVVRAVAGTRLWLSALMRSPTTTGFPFTFFATHKLGAGLNGSSGYKRNGNDPWEPLATTCCVGPADFAFSVEAREGGWPLADQLPWDGVDGHLSFEHPMLPSASARTADDVTMPLAAGAAWEIKHLRAVVLTNIVPQLSRARIEVYPSAPGGGPASAPSFTLTATSLVDLGVMVGSFRAYEIRVGDGSATVMSAAPGQTVWVSGLMVSTGNINEAAYLGRFASPPLDSSTGYFRSGTGAWEPVGGGCCFPASDFAIAMDGAVEPGLVVNQTPSDLQDGQLSIEPGTPGLSRARAADDFTLPTGGAGDWRVTRIRAVMITRATAADRPALEVYSDKGGGAGPEDAARWWGQATSRDLGPWPGDPSFRVVEVTVGDGVATLLTAAPGTTLWVSPYFALTAVTETSLAYFATYDDGTLNGSSGFSRIGAGPWESTATGCCVGATDFAFSVEGVQGAEAGGCAGAQAITDGSWPFDTSPASMDDLAGACGGSGWKSAWFRYTASATVGACTGGVGDVVVSTCGSAFDTAIEVYPDQCPPLPGTSIACNDDSAACGGPGFWSRLVFQATPGASYMIRVGSSSGAAGPGFLTVNSNPVNDTYDGAIDLALAVPITWCNSGAHSDPGPTFPCTFNEIPRTDLWYRFVATTAGLVRFEVCPGSAGGVQLQIAAGPVPPPDALDCGRIGLPCGGLASEVCSAAGQELLVRVGSRLTNGTGTLVAFMAADFDRSRRVSVQDLFSYLAAWFAREDKADLDGSGGVSVQDLFSFLRIWFGTC